MTAHDLVTDLGRAYRDGRLDRRLRIYLAPKVLLLDGRGHPAHSSQVRSFTRVRRPTKMNLARCRDHIASAEAPEADIPSNGALSGNAQPEVV